MDKSHQFPPMQQMAKAQNQIFRLTKAMQLEETTERLFWTTNIET